MWLYIKEINGSQLCLVLEQLYSLCVNLAFALH